MPPGRKLNSRGKQGKCVNVRASLGLPVLPSGTAPRQATLTGCGMRGPPGRTGGRVLTPTAQRPSTAPKSRKRS